ncbi:hypothetical protein QAD02_022682 [Eretmocerus hayati]|uniref:Uncharacterized protein n=1 Tax=Eretmocerus hayati TaxID=131215 RepID=A0ACC2PTT6_9HYME|nr:hypothetical protein QAD02_022682 [Eretmocerus hayati]
MFLQLSNFSASDPTQFNSASKKKKETYPNGEFRTIYSNMMRNRRVKKSANGNSSTQSNFYDSVVAAQKILPFDGFDEQNSIYKSSGRSEACFTFKDYCDHCTIHGLKYVGDTSLSNFERLFWVLSFFLAIIGAGFFIWHLYAKYQTSPIIISRSSEPVSVEQFPFPAITVCNMNNAKKSAALTIIRENDTLQKFFLDDICNFWNFSTHLQRDLQEDLGEWDNIYKFLLHVSQDCSEMLYHCQWHGNWTNCTDIFNPVLTDEGLCCKFNSVPRSMLLYDPRIWENLPLSYASNIHIDWNPEYIFTKDDPASAIPWRAYGSGSEYGLTLAMDVEADEYYCSSTASVGFKMLLHSPVETPQIADFAFTLSPGKETRVIITPHITDADKSIMKIPVKVRRCYFLNEKKLHYYRTYTHRNCLLECEANFTLSACNCMQYYMPVSNETRICGKSDEECARNARRIMKNKLFEEDDSSNVFNVTETPSCKCYPGCNEINYSTEISHSMLMTTFTIQEEYRRISDEYFQKNVALVHIFFIDTSYLKYTKNELYGFAELLSNTGGLLGLFMGFSLLSITEFIYYFTIRLWARMLRRRRNGKDINRLIIQTKQKSIKIIQPFIQ